jgi:AcrR family transcriptional regulator
MAKAPLASTPPRQKRLPPAERKADIIRKASVFFAERGFEGGTRELACELGITQPLLYRYFPAKEDLIREVYKSIYLDRWNPHWDTVLRDRKRPLRDRLQTFYEAYTDAIFTREWLRIYLFSGLKGVEINKWYIGFVEDRVLTLVVEEYRYEAGLPVNKRPLPQELELAWLLHGGIFYYGVRKYIYGLPVTEDKTQIIANALDVFLAGIAAVFGTAIKGSPQPRPAFATAAAAHRQRVSVNP